MAAFCFLGQLLLVGTLMAPAYAQAQGCDLLLNATESNFTVQVTPAAYRANTTYLVAISDNRTFADKGVVNHLLQAVSPANVSVGQWSAGSVSSCNSTSTAVLKATERAANWTSPEGNVSQVEIRAYIIFNDTSAELRIVTLNNESQPTRAPSVTTPNSVTTVHSSIFSISTIQLSLLLVTSKLLS